MCSSDLGHKDACMKRYTYLLMACALLGLTSCGGGSAVGIGMAAAAVYGSKPDAPPDAVTSSQIAAHNSWCYKTIGDVECYAAPQPDSGARLVNVEPENMRPLTAEAYNRGLGATP